MDAPRLLGRRLIKENPGLKMGRAGVCQIFAADWPMKF